MPDSRTPFSELDDVIAIPRLGGLALSPDGRRAVLTVTTLDAARTGYRHALWVVPADGGGAPRRLTRSAKSEAGAAFTADGDLLFVSSRPDADDADAGEAAQLWILPAAGGEARALTRLAGGVDGIAAVARDASTVVVQAPLLPGSTSLEADAVARKKRADLKVDAILHESYPVRYWDHDLGPDEPHLFALDLAGALAEEPARPTTADAAAALAAEAESEDGGSAASAPAATAQPYPTALPARAPRPQPRPRGRRALAGRPHARRLGRREGASRRPPGARVDRHRDRRAHHAPRRARRRRRVARDQPGRRAARVHTHRPRHARRADPGGDLGVRARRVRRPPRRRRLGPLAVVAPVRRRLAGARRHGRPRRARTRVPPRPRRIRHAAHDRRPLLHGRAGRPRDRRRARAPLLVDGAVPPRARVRGGRIRHRAGHARPRPRDHRHHDRGRDDGRRRRPRALLAPAAGAGAGRRR
jgi:hypothetical protein